MNALALLTLNPKAEQINFYKQINRANYDLYCFVDDNATENIIDDFVNYIHIDDFFCKRNGYHKFNPVIKKTGMPRVSAWDKAILYFSKLNRSYKNVWFVEEDVFVPDINLFDTIDRLFPDDDLLSSKNIINTTGELESWAWWKSAALSGFPLPWARSMVCAMRASNRLLKTVDQHVAANKDSQKFIEYIFHTLALHNSLSVKEVESLSGIVWRNDWAVETLNSETLYHPVKSISQQTEFRRFLRAVKQEVSEK
jgi:hypothetical protein